MRLAHWQQELIDLALLTDFVENPSMSVLANAVEHLNLRLVASFDRPVVLLEIGCGTHSLLKNNIKTPSTWEGIDVVAFDRKGNPTIATRHASVDQIPWPEKTFDYVVSNQSIEHWYEYGVDIEQGLREIRRVLKDDGRAILNFPIHLHGHRMFVVGNFDLIDAEFTKAGFEIENRAAVIKSTVPQYEGWRLCGLPDFLVETLPKHEATSYVVEYVARKQVHATSQTDRKTLVPNKNAKLSFLERHLHYGLLYFTWKVTTHLLRRDRLAAPHDHIL